MVATSKVSKSAAVRSSKAAVKAEAIVRSAVKPPLVAVREADQASNLVPRIGKALKKPGLDRSVVFTKIRPTRLTVYAYSVDPTDVSRIVRESEDGSKTVGHLVGNRFRPLKVA